jgi:hypothetical protein
MQALQMPLKESDAARMIGLNPDALRARRMRGRPVPIHHSGPSGRGAVYRIIDLLSWIRAQDDMREGGVGHE